jgi:two-component sensor histidine kinase
VSLVKDGRWVAALGAHSVTQRAWSMSDISLFQETVERTWKAVVRTRTEEAVRASLAEKDALLRSMHHRVKNNLQLITSLINLQASPIEDKRVLALFDATRSRIFSIATVHETLHRSQGYTHLQIAAYIGQLVPELMRFHYIDERIQVKVDADVDTLELDRAVPFGLLLNELVSNACKHAFPGERRGQVTIRCGRDNRCYLLIVSDNGVGLPPDLDYQHPGSMGLRLVHMLAQQLGGNVVVAPGTGTRIEVRFPAVTARQGGNV